MIRAITVLLLGTIVAACDSQGSQGTVTRLHTQFDALVPEGAEIEQIASGFQFTEGPVWRGDHLLFSDIPADTVYRWSAETGVSEHLQPVSLPNPPGVGGSNGLATHPDGGLVLCEHVNRRVALMSPEGERITLASHYDDRRLNSPNDIVYHSSGSAFFTDPPYGLAGLEDDPARELDFNGIYRLDPDGTVTLLTDQQTRPNGIGLSPDEETLYVANSDRTPGPDLDNRRGKIWVAYPVNTDLTLGTGRVFFDANSMDVDGVPDGLAIDVHGNLFATGPGGVLVMSPEGRHLGTISPPELPANVGFGDDGKTLYMTARTSVYRIRLATTGLIW